MNVCKTNNTLGSDSQIKIIDFDSYINSLKSCSPRAINAKNKRKHFNIVRVSVILIIPIVIKR